MTDLRSGRITDILPDNLSSQLEVQAFGYALHRQIEKLLSNLPENAFKELHISIQNGKITTFSEENSNQY